MTVARAMVAAALVVGAALGVAACTPAAAPAGEPTAESSPRIGPPDPSLLPAAAGTEIAMRVAEGVVPPTNRWYSALAFGDPGLPVFPKPLSVAAVDGGFSLGLTRPVASTAVIMAPATPGVTVAIGGATGFGEVIAATPVAVSLDLGPGILTLAQGVPTAALTSEGGLQATLSVPFTVDDDGVPTAVVEATTYGIALERGSVEGTALTLDPGGWAQLFAVPDDGDATEFAAAVGAPPLQADAAFALDQAATTTVTYGETPTVVAVPAARTEGLDCTLGTYATIEGEFQACRASSVSWDVPLVEPAAALDLSGITDAEREALEAALATDADAVPELPADTYFGSKALYRLATLATIAESLGEEDTAARLHQTLAGQLELWGAADGCAQRAERCFTYDPTLRGVVGLATAFGSEEFNDHHFHYGYLMFAAAVAGAHDPRLAESIGPVMDLVAEDIAAPAPSDSFPVRRAFDPVAGHSWASGTSPFADGNNQESSSEAALAWNAVALWADVRGDSTLGDSARWMLAAESEAARRLWLEPDLAAFPEYAHDLVAIEWGAKRDYATWFSAEPAAMLGIQIIPGQPTAMATLSLIDPATIDAQVTAAWGGATPMFADLLLMYKALAGEEQRHEAWESALALRDDAIDDGLTRTAVLAWIAAAG